MKETLLKTILLFLFALGISKIIAQTAVSAIYPVDFVPHEETITEVNARETRLANSESTLLNGFNTAKMNGTLSAWVNNYLPVINLSPSYVVYDSYYYMIDLYELTKFSIDYNHHELDSILISKLKYINTLCYSTYKVERENDIKNGFSGFPNDLNTAHASNSLLSAAVCLKLLGAYSGAVKDSTESFINKYVENKEKFDGFYQTTGYNKEVYLMDIGSNVLFLYKEDPTKYPLTKKTFESFWLGVTQCSYETDNSPHYDAGTGLWTILRMALTHDRLGDLKIREDFHRMLARMAKTVMNNGETAKWAKSMGGILNNNTQLTNDAGEELTWTLKMGYKLFNDSFALYVARKYEDLRMNGAISAWKTTKIKTYPYGINFSGVKNVMPSATTPRSFVTDRLTSLTQYGGTLLGRGDTQTVLVQDKMVLSTGHHPRAPYCLMDMSYTQAKAAIDHRIAIGNLMFDGTHLCTYIDRPGNGNHINRPFLCPVNFPYPLIPTISGDVSPSKDYITKMGFNPTSDYIISSNSAGDLGLNAAYGIVNYSKFQYPEVSATREMVLLHNGILVVLDQMKTSKYYRGGHNAGVIYQVWPSILNKDPNNRWVLQASHLPTVVDNSANPTGFSTLYYFPQIGKTTQVSLLTDTANISNSICTAYSASRELLANDTVGILSLVIPIRKTMYAQTLVNSIKTTVQSGVYTVTLPKDVKTNSVICFIPNQLPTVKDELINLTEDAVVREAIIKPFDLEINPSNPTKGANSTVIKYRLNKGGKVKLKIFNAEGQEISTLVDKIQVADQYSIKFDLSRLKPGIYFCKLEVDGLVSTKKMLLSF